MIRPSIIDVATDVNLLGKYFAGPSWHSWWSVLKAAYGEPMNRGERRIFTKLCQRDPPRKQVRELWIIAGRRAGKDSIASLVATYAAGFYDYRELLRPGERAVVMCLAVDRVQAGIVHRYVAGYFQANELLRPLVTRETLTGLELSNGVDIVISTSDYRAVRGRTIVCAILDEVAFWQDENNTASPGTEVYNAIIPAMVTLPNALLVGISSPYSKRGLLFDRYRRYYGQADDDVLVVQSDSITLNPTLPQSIIDNALEADPEAASAEWMGQFRTDISAFLEREVLDAVTMWNTFELPPQPRTFHVGFADAAGGSGGDSFTVGIAHRDGDIGILDCVREWKPPFQPSVAVSECCELLKRYRVSSIQCDKYGAGFVTELFSAHGIHAEQSAKPKSDLYREFLAVANSRRVQLIDNARMRGQFMSLERRVARGGRDSIDHAPGPHAHDDLCNAAAGALVTATAGRDTLTTWLACLGSNR